MKKLIVHFFIASFFAVGFFHSASAQVDNLEPPCFRGVTLISGDVIAAFQTGNGEFIRQNISGGKIVEFTIRGLNRKADVECLQNKVEKNEQVALFNISSRTINGKRKATLVLLQNSTLDDFKNVLKIAGIINVIFNGKAITIDELTCDVKQSSIKSTKL